MGTKGCVAIGNAEHWRGISNNHDSDPKNLGKALWGILQAKRQEPNGLQDFATEILRFEDWVDYLCRKVCPFCGNPGVYPVGYAVELECPDSQAIRPDEGAANHSHYPVEEAQMDQATVDWLFTEWAYIVNTEQETLSVIKGYIETPVLYNQKIIYPSGQVWNHEKHRYTFALVSSIPLAGPEPDWAALMAKGYEVKEATVAVMEQNRSHPLRLWAESLPKEEVDDQRPPA